MDADAAYRFLRYPAYSLYHVSSLEQSKAGGYPYDIVPVFRTYDTQLQADVIAALKWVESTGVIGWDSILPSLPHSDSFRRAHLRSVLHRIYSTYEELTDSGSGLADDYSHRS